MIASSLLKPGVSRAKKSWLPAGSYFGNLNLVVVEPVFGSSLSGESAEGEQSSDWFFLEDDIDGGSFIFAALDRSVAVS